MAIPVYTLGVDSSLLDELSRLPGGSEYHLQPIHSLEAIPARLHEAPLNLFLIDLDRMGWGPLSEIQALTSQSGRAEVLAVARAETLAQHRAAKFFKVQEFLIHPVHPVQLEMALERCRNLHQLRQENSRLRRAADRYRLELAEQLYCRPADLLPPESPAESSSMRKAIDQSRREKRWKSLLHGEENLDRLMGKIIELATKEWKADRASLMLFDRSEGHLKIKHAAGLDDDIVENTRVRIGEGPAGYVAKTRKPLLVQDSLDYVLANWPRRYEHPSFASIPLVCAGELLGVLNVTGRSAGKEFSEDELESLTAMGAIAAEALDRLLLFEGLKEGYLATMKALALAIERKDPYTTGHSSRVCQYSLMIARGMGLDEKAMETIESAALLHDIGKIGVPHAMVHKPGPLTQEEAQVLRRHPTIGWELLSCLRHWEAVRDAVRHHDEWWDGNGYPDGLRGNDIPLFTRIVTVADAYDAMTTERTYRGAAEHEAALEEIRSKSGIQFDPEVVDCFSRLWENKPEEAVQETSGNS